MNSNHWTVFNGGGAVVADNLSLDEMTDYMTEERFDRRWHAVYCVVVKNRIELRDAIGHPPYQCGSSCSDSACDGRCPFWSPTP